MKDKSSKISSDLRGYFFHYLRKCNINTHMWSATFFTELILILKGIESGKNNKFYGAPIVYRHPLSRIEMGGNCIFRSDLVSNLIGVNQRCTIATCCENALISIGSNSGFSGVVIRAAKSIEIGNDVLCGANVLITDSDWHAINPSKRHSTRIESKPIIIEDNVWLGVNSTVLKGVRIGKNSVIGAHSLVVKDIPQDVVAVGNPCQPIRPI